MTSMNEQGISVKQKQDPGDDRTADRVEGHIRPARLSATASSHLEEALDSTAGVRKESRNGVSARG